MERKTSNSGVVAALETPTGLRFPSIEASRPAAAPVLEEYFGFMYVGEMLKEWRMNKEEVTLERLLAEASNDHLLWEAERANQELILFVNRERVVDKILQYAFSSSDASPQSSPSKMDAQQQQQQQQPQLTPAEIKSFCQDLLSLEVRQGGVFDDSGQTRIIHHLFSSFFTPEDEDGKPRFRAPPPEAGTLLQVLAYRPQSREKVLSYLVDTPAEMFVDFFLVHLDHLIVSDVLTTLVSLLSEAPPSAWLPTGGPRVLQLPLSEFDVSLSLVDAFNEWLIAGSFVDRVIGTILRPDDGDGDQRRRAEITEKAFGLLGQVVMIARSHLHIGQDPPPIFYELMEETRLRPFLRSILKHQNDKVVSEGLALLSSLLVCDRMGEAEKRRRAEEEAEASASNNQESEAASSTASGPSSEMRAATQSHGDLLPRIDGKADDGSADDRRSDGKSGSDQAKMPDSHFNEVLVEVLRDSLPALVMRLRPERGLEAGKPDWQRETDAKQAESDAMVEQRRRERAAGEATTTTATTTTYGKQRVQTQQRKRPFGLLRLKIAESMRALVLHFTVPSVDDTLAEAFFTLLKSLNFPTLLVELLIDNPRMDILHTVIIQTLKPILVKDKPRSFLHAVAKEGSFIRQIIQILPLCGLTGSSPDGELTALRPPVKEIMNSLTRTSLSDPELTSLLDDQGWWDQAVSTNSAGPAPPASALVPFA